MNRWTRWRRFRSYLPNPWASAYWSWWAALAVVAALAWLHPSCLDGGRP